MKKKLSLVVLLIFVQLSSAQIFVNVNATGANNGSSWANAYNHLNDAITAATSGNEIRIAQGNYYPDLGAGATQDSRNATFVIPNGVTILGGYNAATGLRDINAFPTILNGDIRQDAVAANYSIHVVTIGAITATIDGVSIINGNADAAFPNNEGGAVFISTSSGYEINFNQCTFQNNAASSGGGAIRMTDSFTTNGGIVNIDNSHFNNNTSFNGGAIKLSNRVTINNTNFNNNTGRFGGAIYIDAGFSTITNSNFTNNSIESPGNGGAIWSRLRTANSARFVGCTFTNNAAPGREGGAITIETATGAGFVKGIEVEDCTFTGNTAQFGAAIRVDKANDVRIINSVFNGNTAGSSGGGIGIYDLASGAQPFISGCTFTNNSASGVGGNGVYLQSTNATVEDCLFNNNGGGSGFDGTIGFLSSSAIVNRCIITNNNAGRIIRFSSSGSPKISNSLIANNTGVVIDGDNTATLRLENNTIVNNGGGIQNFGTSTVLVFNNILWGNTTNFGTFSGTVDFNIIQGGFASGTNILTADPMFVDAANGNFRLLPGSPAINAGNNPYITSPLDLDGNLRAVDGLVDLGAYEQGSFNCPTITDGIIYVDQSNASGVESGESWANAFTSLQDALDFHANTCGPINEIWVAQGSYAPDQGNSQIPNNRNASFVLPTDVLVLGGFPSGGGNLASRDWVAFPTRLNGEIGASGSADNSAHVITTINVSSNTVLDGFIIENGAATIITTTGQRGGAWLNVVSGAGNSSSPVIRNCIFQNNQAITEGGAIYNSASNGGIAEMSFLGCQFISNQTTSSFGFGGAIFNGITTNGIANMELINCSFISNTSNIGGAIRNISRDGGTGAVALTVTNSLFYQNSANSLPGISSFTLTSTPNVSKIINSTFYGNTTTGSGTSGGGGIRMDNVTAGSQIVNSIFWANTANESLNTNQVRIQGGTVSIQNNTIQNFVNVTNGNLNSNPLFVDELNGNFRLSFGSPAINSGQNAVNNQTLDLDGNPRIFNSIIDRGPFENQTASATQVTATSPTANATNVALDTNIVLTFDGAVANANVNANNILVQGSQTGTIAGAFSGGDTTEITFDPTNNFKPGETITVSVTASLGINNATVFSFTTTVSPDSPGQFVNGQSIISTSANSARSVFSADIDGDGDLDVLSASQLDDKIAWYENDGNGSFGEQQVISTTADGALSVYAADIDGDGDLDVLSASQLDDKIAWYANDGSGNFGAQQIISNAADGASSVYAADIDGDGDIDVLSASLNDDKIAWYENDGTGTFSPDQIISTIASFAFGVYAADIDSDGDMDVLSASSSDGKIAWYENDSAGNFGVQQVISNLADGAQSVFATDLDGDGDLDVLSASFNDDKIAWYENDGAGNFGVQQVISNLADGAQSVFATDLDGDGDLDVLSASFNDGKIAWYENDGAGGFGTQQIISTAADRARSVYAADIDGDGDMDVLSASSSDDKIAWYENTNTTLSLEDFSAEKSLKLYPNPVQNVLNIAVNNGLIIEGFEIYNINGQIIRSGNRLPTNGIELSNLASGMYLIKLKTDKGIKNAKFIKQ